MKEIMIRVIFWALYIYYHGSVSILT